MSESKKSTAEVVASVKRVYLNPPQEITRTFTLTGDEAAKYAFAEALLIAGRGMDEETASVFLALQGAGMEIATLTKVMANIGKPEVAPHA